MGRGRDGLHRGRRPAQYIYENFMQNIVRRGNPLDWLLSTSARNIGEARGQQAAVVACIFPLILDTQYATADGGRWVESSG